MHTKLRTAPCAFLADRDDGLVTVSGRLEFRLLGRFAVYRNGSEIPAGSFGGRKTRTLLRVLATRRGDFVSNDAMTEMLWGDQPPVDPAANLQVLVNRARRALGDGDVIHTGPGGYRLTDGEECSVDCEQFSAEIAAATTATSLPQLRAALARWSGEPLAEDAYANWAAQYRSRMLRIRQDALELAAQLAIDEADWVTAVDCAAAAAEAEPLRENAVLPLVRALAAIGDPAAALRRYDDYRRALADELGVDPSTQARDLHQRLLAGIRGRIAGRAGRQPQTIKELAFVGRSAELTAIRDVLAEAWIAHRRSVITLAGASGSGKSRLLSVLGRHTSSVHVRAYLPERGEPWSMLRTLTGELLGQDVGFRDELTGPLAAALGWLLPESESPVRTVIEAESRRSLLQEAVRRMLDACAQVIVIDDAQWADPTSLGILESALVRTTRARVVLAFRPEELPLGDEAGRVLDRLPVDLRLRIGALPDDAFGDLLDDEQTRVALLEGTDRTPLAVTEVLRALAREGLLTWAADGRWRAAEPAAAERAAELGRQGQRTAIQMRADRARPDARRVLDVLALAARELPARVIALATNSVDDDVLAGLRTLDAAGLVRIGEAGWATAHDMVTDAVAEGMQPAARAQLHLELATALAATAAEPAEVARHWAGSGEVDRAAEAFAVAAAQALAAFADLEAIDLADRALALDPPAILRADLIDLRGQARARAGDITGARSDLRTLVASPTAAHRDRSRWLGRLASLASGADDLLRAAELAELALVEAGDDAAARAAALEIAAIVDMNLDRGRRSAERAAAALALYQQLGDGRGAARIVDARAMATFLAGDVRAGEAALRRAADLFEDSGDLIRVVTPRSTSGHALVLGGRAADGLLRSSAALELARTLGHPEGQTYALWHRSETLAALGRSDEAMSDAHQALDIALGLGHRGWTATSWRAVGIARQAAGDLVGALTAFRCSLEVSDHLDLFASWAAARSALVLVTLGRLAEAAPLVDQALARGPGLGHFEARLAQVELAAARHDPSAPMLARRAIDLADAAGAVQGRDRLVEVAAG